MAGYKPINDTLTLTRGADFVHEYKRDPSDPEFPPGTTAEIVITESSDLESEVLATWPAEDVSLDSISFWMQVPETELIPNRTWHRLLVHYPPAQIDAEIQDFCWYRGPVKRED
jgi:hypothetical protein